MRPANPAMRPANPAMGIVDKRRGKEYPGVTQSPAAPFTILTEYFIAQICRIV